MQLTSANPFEVLAEIAATHKLTPEQWREAREAVLFEGKAWDYIVSHFDDITTTPQVREKLMNRPAITKLPPQEPSSSSSFLGRMVPVEDLEFKLKMQDCRSAPAPKKKVKHHGTVTGRFVMTAPPEMCGDLKSQVPKNKPSMYARYKGLTARTTPEADDTPPPSPAARVLGARSRRGPIDDKWGKMDVDQLAEAAKAAGYKETPAPNGGVRKMRLLNWCRHHLK